MIEFTIIAVTHGFLAAVVFLITSLSASFFLFNAPHGTAAEWRKLLNKLSVSLAQERVKVTPGRAKVLAPLDPTECAAMETFLAHHEAVSRVERRLATLRRRSPYVVFSIIFGIAVGAIVAGPLLAGGKPLTESVPWLSALVGVLGTGAFVIFGSLPHAHWWNSLKEAASD